MKLDFISTKQYMPDPTDPKAATAALKNVQDLVGAIEDGFRSIGSRIQGIADDIAESTSNFVSFESVTKDITRSIRSMGKAGEDLLSNQIKLDQGQLSSKKIQEQQNTLLQKRLLSQNRLKTLQKELNDQIASGLIKAADVADIQNNINKLNEEAVISEKLVAQTYSEQLEKALRIEATLGDMGKLAKGLGKIPIVGQFIEADKVLASMQQRAADGGNKAQVMAAGFKAVGQNIKDNVLDPLKIVTFIFTSLLTGSAGIAGFRKELGISYTQAYGLNTQMNAVAAATNDTYITGEKLKKAFSDLSQSMGFVADYGSQALVTMTNLTGKLGLSNQEASQLTTLSRLQSTDTEAVLDNVGKTVSSMNQQGKTSILLKDVMKEISNTSKATAVSLGSNPKRIAEAVVAAKQLGTTLQQMEATADSLLNFESSIENELKAELLTGKSMNLERARAAALSNDMKTLSEEIGKNEEIIGAFSSGNRLAQQATAEAMGMSREQLAAMVYQQEAMKIGAEGVRAKYGEQAYEALKAQSAQEKFANAVEKLKTVLSSIVQVFSPIIDAVAFLVDNTFVLYGLMGGIALLYLPKIASAAKSFGSSISTAAKSSLGFIKTAATKGMGSAISGIGGDKAKDAAEKATGAGDKAGAGKAGDGIKNTLKGISAGIQSFGKVSLGDILKVAGSALALIALTPAIPALLLLQFVNGKAIQSALTGIGAGFKSIGNALSNPKVILGIAVFTLALMGIGKAISFIAPTVEALGTSISNIVTSVASGISSIITSLGDMIVKLGSSLPQLLLLGPALFGISAGLAAMSISGLFALPTIAGLIALGAVAPALASIGVGGGDSKEGKDIESNINSGIDLTPMIAAINEVKTAVDRLYNKDTSINMDGVKVGSTLVKGSYKAA
jgi:hypothetical protein